MTAERPMIALSPLMDYGRDSLWMLPGYMKAIERAGGVPVMLPLSGNPAVVSQCAQQFDGFLFTGGPDVGPWVRPGSTVGARWGSASNIGDTEDREGDMGGRRADGDATGRSEVLSYGRDRMESLLLQAVTSLDKPIFGICRGIQFINRWFGGTLWQDLPSEHPSGVEHHMNPPYDAFGHNVTLAPGTPLADLFAGQRSIAVNSYHHQAVRDVADGFEVMATAPDGVIEAIRRTSSRFLWAVQWHPEFLYAVDPRSQLLFDTFVDACRA
ncbi:gamma-glutamyl-gamma-aminobutyrate hydrolase family protein [Bifidobacterium sp. UBA744]|uniref:gamma-glutamyl-gamma-aminobutyrate hydrolase family protein n=1 Tax=Bifidobacterium sp. UBA744 TaxID=1946112 RepID=UPI0025BC9787|nr:gamma-glutamyl-gamma-aminobutyrate hydrolase family protein [Bifidobacterium sp. UBA744]